MHAARLVSIGWVVGGLILALRADPAVTHVLAGSFPDAQAAMSRLRVASGLQVTPWAAEPLVQNVTSVCFDAAGTAFVVESGRRRTSVFDVRGLGPWLDDDFALRSEPERAAFLRRVLSPEDPAYPAFLEAVNKGGKGGFRDFNLDGKIDWRDLEVESERIRRVTDDDGDGRADRASVFADGFRGPTSGVAAGILAEGNHVWFTCIPDLWRLSGGRDGSHTNPPITPGSRSSVRVFSGFGVHIAFGGHDLHGLIKGPDGRIYFSIADRGAVVTNREGEVLSIPDTGGIFRCEPDGSKLEIHAWGLRNPQELAFDAEGNLWTGENNGDGGDKARWTLVMEGADYGWTMGWQWLPKMGAWNAERLWQTRETNTARYLFPPVAHIGHGPAGIAFYPGTGLTDDFRDHFFYADFPGGIRTFRVEPEGSFFKVAQISGGDGTWGWLEDNSAARMTGKLLWELSPVDVTFPPFGGVIVADWVQGWEKTGKGRLWHVTHPAAAQDRRTGEVQRVLREGMAGRGEQELHQWMGHADQRVRLEAQWELAGRGSRALEGLRRVAVESTNRHARLHALWAIGQWVRRFEVGEVAPEWTDLFGLLRNGDAEIRGQAARVVGESGWMGAKEALESLMADSNERVVMQAVLGWRHLISKRMPGIGGRRAPRTDLIPVNTVQAGFEILLNKLEQPGQVGPGLQHAAVLAMSELLSANAPVPTLALNPLADRFRTNANPGVRLTFLLAQRRVLDPAIAGFLRDAHPQVVLEAARAIHDVPIPAAMPALKRLIGVGGVEPESSGGSDRGRENFLRVGGTGDWPSDVNFSREEWRAWVMRRAVNAAFRMGSADDAMAIARLALEDSMPESVRVEALEDLADWAKPPNRDRVVGLHRPLPRRDARVAGQALDEIWPRLNDASTPPQVLIAGIRAVAAQSSSGFPARFSSLLDHSSDAVRAEVQRWKRERQVMGLTEWISRLNSGSPLEKREAFARVGTFREEPAVDALVEWMQRLNSGGVDPALQLDVLEAAVRLGGTRLTPLLVAWTNALPSGDPWGRHRMALQGGNAETGRQLFAERADWGCQRCHKLRGQGGDVGPDLTGLGRARGRDYVLQAILDPNAQLAEGFDTLVLELQDGTDLVGVLKSESALELVVQLPDSTRRIVPKSDVKTRQRGLSLMPEGLGELISLRELRDVMEALSE